MTTATQTPAELKVYGSEDCGIEIVHDMTGGACNVLHTIAIAEANTLSNEIAMESGYRSSCGFRRDGRQWWVLTKEFPLSTLEWAATPDYRD